MRSRISPPSSRALPAPPTMKSLPSAPKSGSLPSSPWMSSAALVPTRVSANGVPVMIAMFPPVMSVGCSISIAEQQLQLLRQADCAQVVSLDDGLSCARAQLAVGFAVGQHVAYAARE